MKFEFILIKFQDDLLTWNRVDLLIFHEFEKFIKNFDLRDVAYKIEIIDKLHNCNIKIDKFQVAKALIELMLEKKLETIEPTIVVEKIANIWLVDHPRSVGFVFASKFCFFHQPEKFPIYDRFAVKGLSFLYGKKSHSYNNKNFQFKNGLDWLISALNWNSSYKEIDEYLWLNGQWLYYKEKKLK